MKIAKHFRAFLEHYNYLLIPGIGKFEVLNHVVETNDNTSYNRRLLQFHSEQRSAICDQALLDFLCKQMSVEPCVANSDLQYFGASAKELLMQGLEAEIPGIGFLNMGPQNQLRFSDRSRYHTAQVKVKKFKPAAVGMSFWF
jgi:hypothetical protein